MIATFPAVPSFIQSVLGTGDGVAPCSVQEADAADLDKTLVRDALRGDDRAFQTLVARHKRKVFAMSARFAENAATLDDLCQEVFIRAWRKLSSFRGVAPFEHWLARITVTVCHDYLRRNRRRKLETVFDSRTMELMTDYAPTGEAIANAKERAALLHTALAQLSPDDRLVLTLMELEDRSVREVCGLTGWGESKVKVRAYRARATLRKILEQEGLFR
jgi:RNA polymerase sigma-70 factor (ECF subfamily)